MGNGRTQAAGKQGSESNANVRFQNIDSNNPVTPYTDENNTMLAKIVGEDTDGDPQRLATDTAGRVKVKDVQFDGTVDIGDLQLMNTSEVKIDPATEGTLSSIQSQQFTPGDFTEVRNVRELQNETSVVSGRNTGGGNLSSQSVPDGSKVRVQALQSNDKPVDIDGNFEIVAGQAVNLAVNDVSKISYSVNDADTSDGVCWIVEG